ncbi:MAG: MerR family DNA-binding transcriptional regulator [Streptococcaceae bacterium]|jgi:DNA-binding transcriptional MerR regulator|nr:MerR family DNA-binding transcriptional regulator [Streptococcaceae bacterium]
MMKNNLLTIGEIAKLTGVSVQAIRHYEKIELIKPTYVDPDTSYRYYSLPHVEMIDYIILALNFNIPLKTLRDYFKEGQMVELALLVEYAKKHAQEKIEQLQAGFQALQTIEKAIQKHEQFPVGERYERVITSQKFITKPLENVNDGKYECLKLYQTIDYDIEETPDFGVLLKKTNERIEKFAVVETSKHLPSADLIVPKGKWKCYKSFESSIHRVEEIFADDLCLVDAFIAIESEIITSKVHVERPLFELRVLI